MSPGYVLRLDVVEISLKSVIRGLCFGALSNVGRPVFITIAAMRY